MDTEDPFLYELERVVQQRIAAADGYSYTAKLVAEGTARIAQKVGEEALEVALASVTDSGDEFLRNEIADLIFHLLVLMADRGIRLTDIAALLRERHAARQPSLDR
ncbi:MAG: phosphoribosyl-ATP diphosphatase [Pseudomonadota bacterium]